MKTSPKITSRKKEVKLRKNFLPTFIITVFLWAGVAGIVYFIDPHERGAIPLLFTVIFFAILFTFSIIFISTRRGLISSIGITLFLILRYFGVGNWLNLLLLTGICIAFEIYFIKKQI